MGLQSHANAQTSQSADAPAAAASKRGPVVSIIAICPIWARPCGSGSRPPIIMASMCRLTL